MTYQFKYKFKVGLCDKYSNTGSDTKKKQLEESLPKKLVVEIMNNNQKSLSPYEKEMYFLKSDLFP